VKKKNLISVVGPTGIGKTRLAIDLAKHFNTEIVSCDSRQFFREMKIGTASPSAEELAEAPHHFIGNLSVEEYYSIGQYEEDALKKLNELFKNMKPLFWWAEA
jgi:tRNA dimethylallyltransferase